VRECTVAEYRENDCCFAFRTFQMRGSDFVSLRCFNQVYSLALALSVIRFYIDLNCVLRALVSRTLIKANPLVGADEHL
jgi:hypothetical protein